MEQPVIVILEVANRFKVYYNTNELIYKRIQKTENGRKNEAKTVYENRRKKGKDTETPGRRGPAVGDERIEQLGDVSAVAAP